MDPRIYKLHVENEQEHWWYKARREIISSIISKFVFKNNKLKILDFGAGSGANTIALSHYGEVYVYEKNKNALAVNAGLKILYPVPPKISMAFSFSSIMLLVFKKSNT